MALFFIASGAVYDLCIEAGKYATIHELLVNKSKRLLFPFMIFCFGVTTHVWYFARNDLAVTYDRIFLDTITCENGQYLWFLLVLFLCFLCIALLEKIVKSKAVIMVGLLLLSFMHFGYEIVDRLLMYALWFYLGRLAFNKIKWHRYSKRLLALGAVFLLAYFLFNKLGMPPLVKQAYFKLMTLSACLFVIGFAGVLTDKNFSGRFVNAIQRYGFEIYLFSCPIQVIYYHMEKCLFDYWQFNASVSVLFYFVQIILTLLICVYCAPFVRKLITWKD